MIALTILLTLSVLFGRVTVNVLVFVLRVVFFHAIFFCNAVHVGCSASGFCIISKFCFRIECFDGSEVTGKGNDSIVQKQNRVVEEIKEVELRSRRGKLIYNRTYNSVGLNKVSHSFRRGRAPSRLPMKKF